MNFIDYLYISVLLGLGICMYLLILAGYRCKWNAFWKQVSIYLLAVEGAIFLLAAGVNFIIAPDDDLIRLAVLIGVTLMTGLIARFTPIILRNILDSDIKNLFKSNNPTKK